MIRLLLFLIFTVPFFASAVLKIDINRGHSAKIDIFVAKCNADLSDVDAVANIVKADLVSTGLFNILDATDIQCSQNASATELGSKRGIVLLLAFAKSKDGQFEVKYRLIDSGVGVQMLGKSLTCDAANYRQLAHAISDGIYNKITGDSGYFNTRIAHISDENGVKKLAIMDQDTANLRFFTDGKSLVLTPRFSPDGASVIYMSYQKNQGKVYIKDLMSNKSGLVGSFSGLVSAPRFAPDGKLALIARSVGKTTDIYSVNLANNSSKKLTHDSFINTSPSYSPDQKKIVFNSDRAGSQQIYVMNADGTNQKRISYGGGSYATPVWSPRGDLISFTKIYKGGFYIGVMKPDGSAERILTTGYLVESPSWSPNGRLLIFTHEERSVSGKKSRSRIYSIDITGKNERIIYTKYNASGPSWSNAI